MTFFLLILAEESGRSVKIGLVVAQTCKDKSSDVNIYHLCQGFGHAQLGHGNSVLGSSQFKLMTERLKGVKVTQNEASYYFFQSTV